MTDLLHRRLGNSTIEVSVISLGSWRTYERIPREVGVAVLDQARESGITFLEVARYDDETGKAPLRTGYSEVVFGEIFRRSGWPREDVTIATKLWWEFWPDETALQELDASLERTGLDHFDFVYSDPPPVGLPMEAVVTAINDLVDAGRIRGWGIVNWAAERIAEATAAAYALGVLPPCAAQLAYSVVRRSPVEDAEMVAALDTGATSVVASHVLAGGLLSGKYTDDRPDGRMRDELRSAVWQPEVLAAKRLRELADSLDTTPAALAIAHALIYPRTATVLLGATRPEQVAENVGAVALAARLAEEQVAELRALGFPT
jgi:aryl-alcohol dehydrogenase-like predicted oxidoreductase